MRTATVGAGNIGGVMSTMRAMAEATREARLRRLASRQNLLLRKSRVRSGLNIDNRGGYCLINHQNYIVAVDLSLDAVEAFLRSE